MTPTPKLRFINRKVPATMSDDVPHTYTLKILQQWWEDNTFMAPDSAVHHGEWRDVPLEME